MGRIASPSILPEFRDESLTRPTSALARSDSARLTCERRLFGWRLIAFVLLGLLTLVGFHLIAKGV